MKGDRLEMSGKERRRMLALGQVQAGRLTLVEASERLGLGYRQAKRIWARWRACGEAGLIHGLRGQESNRTLARAFRERVLEAYRTGYEDFGPTLASEYLASREGLVVHPETLRRWLHEAHLWIPRRAGQAHRRRRARREGFGELVQLDGSDHAWFEQRAARACLMVMVDDATGRTVARMAGAETTQAAYEALRAWIEDYGVPAALYVDGKGQYFPPREPNAQERDAGVAPQTDFGRACHRLDVELIRAHSPQAKGRVERKNAVFQDRLVKELRLRGARTIEEANAMLPEFVQALNARFTCQAASALDRHRPRPEPSWLDETLCWESRRTLARDFSVAYEGVQYQIARQENLPAPGVRLTMRRTYDGRLRILHGERPLEFTTAARQHN